MLEEEILRILTLKNWAAVGLSSNPERAAFGVTNVLLDHGHKVFPVHPKAETVHGQPGFANLKDIGQAIDVVDIFVTSSLAGAVVDEAIAIGAKAVWLQLGVIDEAAIERARSAGLMAVMDRCPAIEYSKKTKG